MCEKRAKTSPVKEAIIAPLPEVAASSLPDEVIYLKPPYTIPAVARIAIRDIPYL